jgi:hypothetical protein
MWNNSDRNLPDFSSVGAGFDAVAKLLEPRFCVNQSCAVFEI